MTTAKNDDCNNLESFELHTYGPFLKRSTGSAAKGSVCPEILSKTRIGASDSSEKHLHSKQDLEWLNLQTAEKCTSQDKTNKCRLKSPKIPNNNEKMLDGKNSNLTRNSRQIESLDLHVYETMALCNTYQNFHICDDYSRYKYFSGSPEDIENISEIECLSNQACDYVERTEKICLYFQNKGYQSERDLGKSTKEISEKREGDDASLDKNSRCKNIISRQNSYDDNLLPEESHATLPTADRSTASNIYASIVENNDVLSVRTKSMNQSLLKDESLGFLQKMQCAKAACSFNDYVILVIYLLYKEVRSYFFLDLYYIVIGLCVLISGALNFSKCQLSEYLPFLLMIFGTMAILNSSIEFSLLYLKLQRKLFSCLSFMSTIFKVFMALFSFVGLYMAIICYPPSEVAGSSNYCSPLVYWSAMYAFSLNMLLYFIILFHGIMLLLWYCL